MNKVVDKPIVQAVWQATHTSADRTRYLEAGLWRDRTLLDDFLAYADKHPAKTAIVAYVAGQEQPKALTFGELKTLVDRCAGALIAHGVEPSDMVSLQLPNGWEFPVVALAAMRAGAIPNPLPPIYREKEVSFMLRHAASKIFVVPSEFKGFSHADLGRKMLHDIPTLKHVVRIGGSGDDLIDFERDFIGTEWEKGAGFAQEIERRRPKADDVAVLLFTSGTTGTPKAALHTHNTIWSAGQPLPDAMNLTGEDVGFMASTMGHLTGFYWGMLMPLSMGQKIVYQDIWDPKRLIGCIDKEGITWTLAATPFAMDLVHAKSETGQSFTTLRSFACGGAPIPPHVATEVQAKLGVSLISLWGCTEVGICTIHKLGAPVETLAKSDGMPVKRMQLRVVDEDGKPVPKSAEGRLHVRGPSIFVGYLKQPELTAALQTADGWYDTGDIGRETDDGGIRLSGRSKDIIIRGGQNVPVVEIENELAKMPGVKDVVVIGIPDPRLGERGCAVIVPTSAPLTLDDIRRQLETAGMAKQFWPEHVEIVSEMPRTPAGKIQKFVLRERFAGVKAN